jgi:selenocysteine-specific elongation factor
LAVALQGVKLEAISRGDTLATPGAFAASTEIDARVRLAEYYQFELKNRERVRIHHGACEVMGRVILLEHDVLRSGEDALAQFKLEKPLVAAAGDHVVLRKYSPARVIGGAVVIDPRPERHKRRDPGVIDQLKLKEEGDPRDILLTSIEQAGMEGVGRTSANADLLRSLVDGGDAVEVDTVVLHPGVLGRLAEEVEDLAGAHQARFPLQWGIDKEELRQKTGFPHGAAVFNKVLDILKQIRPIFVKDNRVRSGSEQLELSGAIVRELDGLRDRIDEAGLTFPTRGELDGAWKSRHRLVDALQYLKDRGDIVEIGDVGVMHRRAFERCVEELRRLFEQSSEVTVADLKNSFGLTRKHAIPLFEMLDERRITKRTGNVRVKGPRFPL